MWAAKEGHSTLGIPRSVGEEFIGEDKTPNGHAAGILFVAPDGDVLLLRRSAAEKNYPGYWALPGGKGEGNEAPEQIAERETVEEIGLDPGNKRKIIDRRATPNGMAYHTFAQPAATKFAPKLNGEHSGYAWFPLDDIPVKTHPALKATLAERVGIADDMAPEDWQGLREGFVKWLGEEELEDEHAEDCAAYDRRPTWMEETGIIVRTGLAFDRDSVRSFDKDGRLHVRTAHISKAAINPYLGSEIPNWQALGLDPKKVYKLYRDPAELQKAAPTFNNLPVLDDHIQVSADEPMQDRVVGTTGSECVFNNPYLDNCLSIWTKGGIEAIERETKKELSSAYHYRADMTPGEINGEQYDGVMRDIVGNHVALVEEGRAGSDVVVGDSNKEIAAMKSVILTRKGSLAMGVAIAALMPKIAKDAKLDPSVFAPAFAKVTAKNFGANRKAVIAELTKIAKDKKLIASDVSLDDVDQVMGLLDKYDPKEKDAKDAEETDPITGEPIVPVEATDDGGDLPGFLKGKLSEDDYNSALKMMNGGKTAGDEFPPKKDDDDKDDKDAKDEAPEMKPPGITKDAANKLVAEALAKERKAFAATREAENFVRPWIGQLNVAMDSASAVLQAALKSLGVATDDIGDNVPALKAVLSAQPKPGDKRGSAPIALDAAGTDDFAKRYPKAASVQVL